MQKNNHEVQLLLKGIKSSFSFQFSVNKDDLYIDNINQNIDYGWEVPSEEDKTVFAKPITQVSFSKNKTNHSITLNGFIYINTQLGCGLDNFTKLKNIANSGETWYLIDSKGTKIVGSGKGIWYVKNITQNSTDFITGINALKINFSITINKYS